MFRALILLIFTQPSFLMSQQTYLNGVDITGSINQDLKQVDIHIDEKGNVFISAPHYTVIEQASYLPLGEYKGKHPEHKAPTPIKQSSISPSPSGHGTSELEPPDLESDEQEQEQEEQEQQQTQNRANLRSQPLGKTSLETNTAQPTRS